MNQPRAMGFAARIGLQQFWLFLYRVALAGMGYMNNDPRYNGEDHFLSRLAKVVGRESKHPVTIFDIGANEGDFSAGVASRLQDFAVHAFEPHPQTFARLQRRFSGDPRFLLNHAAVAASTGHITLYDYDNADGSNMASVFKATFEDIYPAKTHGLDIPAITLDDYVEKNGIDRITLIKIDVEGAEKLVLDGAQRTLQSGRIDAIQFEFNAHALIAGFSLLTVARILPDFDIYRMVSNGLVPVITSHKPYNTRVEIFKYCNCVALRRESSLHTLVS